MDMNHQKTHQLVLTAMFAALVCVATMVIQIPSPMNGYVNLGDCFVLAGAWILGPFWGLCAGGIGSMLADVLTGYAYYAPGTLVIKGLMALVAAVLFLRLRKVFHGRSEAAQLISGLVGEAIMVVGYFGYAALLLGNGMGAAASIPSNLVQGVVGLVCAMLLAKVFAVARLRLIGEAG